MLTRYSLLVGILSTTLISSSSASAASRPNILIILTDDMGFSDLGCFGGEIDTPHLDSLAAGGLRFTEFYNTARCWPTRATLMSGRYGDRLGPSQITIPEVLRKADYQTGMVGKWHLGKDPMEDGPIQRGFDDFYGTMTGAGSFWNPKTLTRNSDFTQPDSEDFYYTDKIGAEAVRQIEAFSSERPFFQYVAFTAAHWPLHAPEASINKYLSRYTSGWEQLRRDRYARMLEMGIIDEARWPLPPLEQRVERWDEVDHKAWRIRNMAIYAAMVDHMDQAVGGIVDALDRTGQLENTLIVYFHDNGACHEHLSHDAWGSATNVLEEAERTGQKIAMGDRYDVPMGGPHTYGSVGHNWAHAQNTPMRRYKANVHNGGACTPAIMHWPRGLKTKPGSITTQRGHVVDMLATCLELAGAKYPQERQGHRLAPHESLSLVPILEGRQVDRDHPYIFNHSGTHAIVKGDYKIVRERTGPWALYNLAQDRTETKNIADEDPDLVTTLAAIWDARWAPSETEETDSPSLTLFDGKTFSGWEGDTTGTWRIEDGAITAGSLEQTAPRNEFLSTTADYENFKLRLKFKITGTHRVNAGVQFRTTRIPNHHEVMGYQADIGPSVDGHLYDESRRRKMLATPDDAALRKAQAAVPQDGWQTYRIRAEGNRIQLWLNGVQTVDYVEQDTSIPQTGIVAVQIHGGMRAIVAYKDIVLEPLPATSDP